MTILIYNDCGVTKSTSLAINMWAEQQFPHVKITPVSADQIISTNILSRKDVRAFVMPGGQARSYKELLEGTGERKLAAFVEGGGLYYGICGGGYYPCRRTDFKGAHFIVQEENTGLVFFEGMGKGSIAELTGGKLYDKTPHAAAAAEVIYDGGKLAFPYYNGGAVFHGDFSNAAYEILATYKTLPVNANVAAVKCCYGEGCAVLTGIHPEVTPDSIAACQFEKAEDERAAMAIAKMLGQHGSANQNFARYIFKDLIKLYSDLKP